jgi:Zn-dependent protease with chaperone function
MRAGRIWSAVALTLVLAAAGDSTSQAGVFDGIFGKPVYKSFEGKFIEKSQAVQDVLAGKPPDPKQKNSVDMASLTGVRRLIGSSTWDGIPAPALTAYATAIEQRLIAGWPGAKPTITLSVTSNPGLEANSTAAGDIYIARGWFEQCASEDEIAAIIGHELSHILLNHFQRSEANEGRQRAIASAASAAVTAMTLGSMRPVQVSQQLAMTVTDQKKLNDNVHKTLLIKFAIGEVSSYLLNSAWARQQEDEADLLGIDLMRKAGYSVMGMTGALQKLLLFEKAADKQQDILTDAYKDALKGAVLTGKIDTIKQTLSDVAESIAIDQADKLRKHFMRDHPSTEDRIKATGEYIGREYDDDPGGKPKAKELETFRSGKAIKPVFANLNTSGDAMAKLRENALAEGKALAAKGASGPTATAPYSLRVMAVAQKSSGDTATSLKTLQRAADSPLAAFQTLLLLVGEYADAGQYAAAHATLNKAADRFGSVEATYPAAIKLAVKESHNADAEQIFSNCKKVKNSDLVDECRSARDNDDCADTGVLGAFKCSNKDVGDVIGSIFE